MISSKKYVDETLRKYNLVANKSLGQNFLVESDIANEIVEKANVDEKTCAIEVGPGLGALTEILVMKAKKVMAFEIDENMVKILKDTFKNDDKLIITQIDFLKVDMEELIEQIKSEGFENIVFISNLPYYITSKLLNKILINGLNINTIVTMMQKEVGQKIIRPDSKDYNLLSVILDYQYNTSIIKFVGKNSYLPRPEIDSIVLKFEKVNPRYNVALSLLVEITNALFSARRKTVYNNLKSIIKDTNLISQCLKFAGIEETTHVEQINIEQIIKICNFIK